MSFNLINDHRNNTSTVGNHLSFETYFYYSFFFKQELEEIKNMKFI